MTIADSTQGLDLRGRRRPPHPGRGVPHSPERARPVEPGPVLPRRPERDARRAAVHLVGDVEALAPGLGDLIQSLGLRPRRHQEAAAVLEPRVLQPGDRVITDVCLRGASGLHLLSQLRRQHPDLPVIVLTESRDVTVAVEALKLGATDYLTPPFRRESLIEALGPPASPVRPRSSRIESPERLQCFQSLTTRESEIVDRIVAGLSSKQIAFELGLSKRTVDSHRARIMKKLDTGSLAELVRLAVLHKLYRR